MKYGTIIIRAIYLDGVVDEPLQPGESTDHDDPGSEPLPHTRPT